MENLKGWKKEEHGMVIVEATFVFPIMFFVLFFLIYLGNAYYLKAKIDNCVTQYALAGAAKCSDPLLLQEGAGKESAPGTITDVKPYRYMFSNETGVEAAVEEAVSKEMKGDGFFGGMGPHVVSCDAKLNGHVLYHTFSVEASYKIEFPIRFLGSDRVELLRLSSFAEVPVTDAPEFIRNTDMVIDYLEQNETANKAMNKIQEAIQKARDFINGGGGE